MSIETIDRDQRIIERVTDELMTGRKFMLHAASLRSAPKGGPPSSRDGYGHAVQTLGRMAKSSDAMAQIASAILKKIPLYQTDYEAAAAIWEAAAAVLREPYDDVIGRSMPDAGRFSAYQKEWTLAQRVALVCWLEEATSKYHLGRVPGIGWVIERLATEHRIPLYLILTKGGASR